MFPEWTDLNDIDYYTGGISELMKDIAAYPTSASYRALPPKRATTVAVAPEAPTGMVINSPETKSAYEASPNTTAPDGHPLGHQPQYNVLYSAPPSTPVQQPPQTETYKGRGSDLMQINRDHINILLFFIVIFLGLMLAQARAANCAYENSIRTMFLHLQQTQTKH